MASELRVSGAQLGASLPGDLSLSAPPATQRRAYFRLWNAALRGFLAVPDHVEDMKAGRVVVSEPQAGGSCIWYYEDGLLKNQVPAERLGRGIPEPQALEGSLRGQVPAREAQDLPSGQGDREGHTPARPPG